MKNLGTSNKLELCDPNRVVHNFSSTTLPTRICHLLAFGLDFRLPVYRLDFYKFFAPLEILAHRLSKESCSTNCNDVIQKIKRLSHKFFYSFKPSKVFSPVIHKSDLKQFKEFSKKHDIVVSSANKGNGVVLVEKPNYISSMRKLLQDSSKIEVISEPIGQVCRTVEDRINRFLLKMKNQKILDETNYNELHASGSGPGVLYGKPKIHKPDVKLTQSVHFQYL